MEKMTLDNFLPSKMVVGIRIVYYSMIFLIHFQCNSLIQCNASISGAVRSGWSPLRNLEKRIIREREIGGWYRRGHFEGICTLAHCPNVPLQFFSGETTPILGIGYPLIIVRIRFDGGFVSPVKCGISLPISEATQVLVVKYLEGMLMKI